MFVCFYFTWNLEINVQTSMLILVLLMELSLTTGHKDTKDPTMLHLNCLSVSVRNPPFYSQNFQNLLIPPLYTTFECGHFEMTNTVAFHRGFWPRLRCFVRWSIMHPLALHRVKIAWMQPAHLAAVLSVSVPVCRISPATEGGHCRGGWVYLLTGHLWPGEQRLGQLLHQTGTLRDQEVRHRGKTKTGPDIPARIGMWRINLASRCIH